jgi:hypothetical protein
MDLPKKMGGGDMASRCRAGVKFVSMVAAAALLAGGCKGTAVGGGDGSAGSTPPAGGGRAVSPLDNPTGTKSGLAPIVSGGTKSEARKVIDRLRTAGRGPKTGYQRDMFGHAWMDTADGVPLARNGCDTRNDLLARDGLNLHYRAGSHCVVISMTLDDPYTGRAIAWRKQKATEVQIDHVVPLSYAWQMGAARWDVSKRQQIANDPLNLLPVDGPANSGKGDSGPASWLPPNKQIRCAYSVRFSQVALKYALPVTAADKQMMLVQCGG